MGNEIIVRRGNTPTFTVTIKDGDGIAINITGYTVYFTVKVLPDGDNNDSEAIIKKDVSSHIDAVNGVTSIVLTADDTNNEDGDYEYDIKIKDASGNYISSDRGVFSIREVIGRRTT